MQTLDRLIGKGLQKGTILDIYGAAGTGKSQLCAQICLNFIRSNSYKNKLILFEDNTGNFRPERLLEMAREQHDTNNNGHDPQDFKSSNNDILDRIIVSRVTNSHEQIQLVDKMMQDKTNTLSDQKPNHGNVGLFVIDSITDHFSFEYSKESKFLSKHVQFMRYMRNLSYLALTMKIPVVITNTTRMNPTTNLEEETMHRSVSLFAHQKIYMTKITTKSDSSGLFLASVIPSFHYKKQVMYTITKRGVIEKIQQHQQSQQ